MIRHVCLLLLLCSPGLLLAQKFTISGNVRDASTGEDLIGATILAAPLQGVGTYSNEYGFFSLTLPASTYTIQVRYSGYRLFEKEVSLQESQRMIIELAPLESTLEVVEIVAEKENSNVSETQMGLTKFNPKDVETVPVLFGEKDIIKVIQLSPGVKTAGEGNTGFFVRGGGLDQNLILLDEAAVYNPSHLLGFFSVFNSDAIKDVSLYKGGMPAEYGGRASSVLDIRMKEGNKKEYDLSGGIGLISSRLTVEGPIQKDKSSFIISGRRTYLDLFLNLSSDEA
ncbi:MAG: TonB-dependent receptor, partial [Bacteroidota bacterium]